MKRCLNNQTCSSPVRRQAKTFTGHSPKVAFSPANPLHPQLFVVVVSREKTFLLQSLLAVGD